MNLRAPSSKAGQSRAGAVFYVSVIPISVARHVAWSRAELARCVMLVLFLSVSGQLCSAPRFLSGHTDRNNTKIKHRAAQLCSTLLV